MTVQPAIHSIIYGRDIELIPPYDMIDCLLKNFKPEIKSKFVVGYFESDDDCNWALQNWNRLKIFNIFV